MIEVTFKFPDELDLAMYYLNEQFKRFIRDDIVLPFHEISFSESEIKILMWYSDDDDSDNDDGDGGDDDPLWPIIMPDEPLTFSITGYIPEFTSDFTSAYI